MKRLLLVFLLVANIYFCTSNEIVKARLESCPGCSLNRLQDVRKFAYDDLPNYEGVDWKKISGAPPELVFLNDKEEEVERHPLKDLNRKECNDLLQSKGFSPNNKEL
ncbi:unnamed protein product [Psylliodes chrysocephalus]|uniref:Selenoprotein M n=1 Tax=Psylliodes chrysocephalus TaxID=3402493 RepID=A0A9P0CHK3_9CUCU|nr:unnamed protein product [Psylliodes chrysocephala]